MNVRSFVTDYSVDYSEPYYASPIYFSKLDWNEYWIILYDWCLITSLRLSAKASVQIASLAY